MICWKFQDFIYDFVDKFNEIGVTIMEIPELKRDIGKHDIYAFKKLYDIFKKYNFDRLCCTKLSVKAFSAI